MTSPQRKDYFSSSERDAEIKAYMSRVGEREDTVQAEMDAVAKFLEQEKMRLDLPETERCSLKKIEDYYQSALDDTQKLTGSAGLMTAVGFGALTATARQTYKDSRVSDNAAKSFFKGVKSFFENIPSSVGSLMKINAAKRAQKSQKINALAAYKEMENIQLSRAMLRRTSIDKMADAGMGTPQPGHTPRTVMDDVAAGVAVVASKEPGQESPRVSVEKDSAAPPISDPPRSRSR